MSYASLAAVTLSNSASADEEGAAAVVAAEVVAEAVVAAVEAATGEDKAALHASRTSSWRIAAMASSLIHMAAKAAASAAVEVLENVAVLEEAPWLDEAPMLPCATLLSSAANSAAIAAS